jgi:type VI secretion system protein ImpC
MPGKMRFDVDWGPSPNGRPKLDGDLFAILAIAPFRGAGVAPGPLDERPLRPVDVESFDQVLSRIAPRVALGPLGEEGADLSLAPKCLDDLHPDALLRDVPALRSLAALLSVAKDPATFRQAAGPAPGRETDAAALSRLLGRAPPESAIDRLVRDAVSPHIVPGPDPRQAEVVAGLEAAVGAALRVALRRGEYQTLEARWRSLRRLVYGVEPDGPVRIHVLDATREEWTEGLDPLRRAIERGAAKEGLPRFSLIVLEATFGMRAADVAALGAWAELARSLGTPIIADAGPSIVGAADVRQLDDPSLWSRPDELAAKRWAELRHRPGAAMVALALPKVLARAPYGKLTDPFETFAFEETSDDPGDSGFVWSGGAWSCAELMGAASGRVEDVPFAIFESAGGRKIQGSTEVLLPDRAAEAILDRGLVPIVAHAAANAIVIPRLQSIADPLSPLGVRPAP